MFVVLGPNQGELRAICYNKSQGIEMVQRWCNEGQAAPSVTREDVTTIYTERGVFVIQGMETNQWMQ